MTISAEMRVKLCGIIKDVEKEQSLQTPVASLISIDNRLVSEDNLS